MVFDSIKTCIGICGLVSPIKIRSMQYEQLSPLYYFHPVPRWLVYWCAYLHTYSQLQTSLEYVYVCSRWEQRRFSVVEFKALIISIIQCKWNSDNKLWCPTRDASSEPAYSQSVRLSVIKLLLHFDVIHDFHSMMSTKVGRWVNNFSRWGCFHVVYECLLLLVSTFKDRSIVPQMREQKVGEFVYELFITPIFTYILLS